MDYQGAVEFLLGHLVLQHCFHRNVEQLPKSGLEHISYELDFLTSFDQQQELVLVYAQRSEFF